MKKKDLQAVKNCAFERQSPFMLDNFILAYTFIIHYQPINYAKYF